MFSGLGFVAEAAHSRHCTCVDDPQYDQPLLSRVCSPCNAIAHSMNYLANALTTRPASFTSMQSFPAAQLSLPEDSTPEDCSEEEGSKDIDTKATSVTDLESKSGTRSLSSPRSKTTYRLAHPPPISSHRAHLHIRPRVLLQLQKISKTVRPKPVLEVLPSVTFATRLSRRFPRTFKGKAGLGADDLVIVSSENYDAAQPDTRDPGHSFDNSQWEEREIIAAVCQPSKDKSGCQGKTEICLSSGATWTASKLGNGSYELISIDEHGLKTIARWVLRLPRQRSTPAAQGRPRSPSLEERKFNFSVLNPKSRRHAVIGTLDQHSIEVSDRYSNPAVGSKSPGPSAPISPATGDNLDGREGQASYLWHSDRSSVCALDNQTRNSPRRSLNSTDMNLATEQPIEMTECLRILILVTGLWVASEEEFSPSFNNDDLTQGQPALSNPGSKHQRRSLSLNINRSGGEILSSTARSTSSDTQPNRVVLPRATASSGVPLAQSTKSLQTPPRRSMSMGSTFIRRVTSRKLSTTRENQLELAEEFDGSEAEGHSLDGSSIERDNGLRKRTLAILSSRTTGSPLRGYRTTSYQNTMESPLEPVISYGLDPPGEAPASSKEAPKKPRRLKRLFRLRSQTAGGL